VSAGRVSLEGVDGTFPVETFAIAKYPITYGQYKAFLAAEDGYYKGQFWKGLHHKRKPGTQNRPIDNHPADNIAWFDAMAFCRWLTYHQHQSGLIPLTSEIRLPTEWEWQQAATGGDAQNTVPWGQERDTTKANMWDTDLRRTTAVGMYPQGAVKHLDIMDMCGNVFEWCLNSPVEPYSTDYRDYLKRIVDGKDDFDGPATRSFRGAGWLSPSHRDRSTLRGRSNPVERDYCRGFRVVLGESFLGSIDRL
jgi:formylglycine-generating enzyme required for sulfatase activity